MHVATQHSEVLLAQPILALSGAIQNIAENRATGFIAFTYHPMPILSRRIKQRYLDLHRYDECT